MGNKWELQDYQDTVLAKCPCGKGACISRQNNYQDDFCRDHTSNETFCTCAECNEVYRYIPLANGWLTKEKYSQYKLLCQEANRRECDLILDLYHKYQDKIKSITKTQKGLFETLYKFNVCYLPGSLQTFYKHGADYYFSERNLPSNIEPLSKLISETIGLQPSEIDAITELKEVKSKVKQYLCLNIIK